MKYLLDTNVLSESVKTSPQNTVLKSIKRHQHEIVTAAPVWHELYFGCQRLPASRKRQILETYGILHFLTAHAADADIVLREF